MYTLPHDIIIVDPELLKGVEYKSPFLNILDGVLRLSREYKGKLFEWDGCTGARDGAINDINMPITWVASAVHDALYRFQFIPMSNKNKDKIFLKELIKCRFRWGWNTPIEIKLPRTDKPLFIIRKDLFTLPTFISARMYYLGVRGFGWIARWNNRHKAKTSLKAATK